MDSRNVSFLFDAPTTVDDEDLEEDDAEEEEEEEEEAWNELRKEAEPELAGCMFPVATSRDRLLLVVGVGMDTSVVGSS